MPYAVSVRNCGFSRRPSLGDEVAFEPVAHLALKDCRYRDFQLVERPEEPAGKPLLQVPPHGLGRVQLRSVGREKLQLDVAPGGFHVLPDRLRLVVGGVVKDHE